MHLSDPYLTVALTLFENGRPSPTMVKLPIKGPHDPQSPSFLPAPKWAPFLPDDLPLPPTQVLTLILIFYQVSQAIYRSLFYLTVVDIKVAGSICKRELLITLYHHRSERGPAASYRRATGP